MANHAETLADRVRRAVENTGLSHIEFARQAKIKSRTLQDVLGGQSSNPEMATLQGISKRSGVSVDELIFGAAKPKEKVVGEMSPDELVKMLRPTLAPDESELLSLYRKLKDFGRETVLETARGLAGSGSAPSIKTRRTR